MTRASASANTAVSRIRPLSPSEVAAYDHVQARARARARIIMIPWLPGNFAATTLGRFVLLARPQPTDGTSALLAHELVHVEQWGQQGRVRFVVGYVSNFLAEFRRRRRWMDSYRALDAEIEARDRTRNWWNRTHESAISAISTDESATNTDE